MSEYQDFLEESFKEAAGEDNMGVVFVVSGKKIVGVPAPLTVEMEPVTGQAQRRKTAWAIMVPLTDIVEPFPKGTLIKDSRNRIFKVYRTEEKRMCLEIFVMDTNR